MGPRICPAYSPVMPQILNKIFEAQMLGGIFSTRENAIAAMDDDQNLDIARQDVQILFPLSDKMAREAFVRAMIAAIRSGYILNRRHDALKPVHVIEISDQQRLGLIPLEIGN
jgi:hypothetical protein